MTPDSRSFPSKLATGFRPFRTAVFRGLGVVAPPLLTLVILVWMIRTVDFYILEPILDTTANLLVRELADIHSQLPDLAPTTDPTVFVSAGKQYKLLDSGQYIPLEVYTDLLKNTPAEPPPENGLDAYRRYVETTYLHPWIVGPVFIVVFVGFMYLLGALFAAGVGRAFWNWIEHGVGRLPIVRAIYNSSKQVTNYIFSDRELEFTRVVAVEYPCRGIWSLAFVTNEGMRDVQKAAGEPVLTILLPTSPVPVSGYTMLVPKSEVLDVDMTVEQAVEYIVSCGVVLPPQQLEARIEKPTA